MKNKKNVVLALVILLGVVALGIGYAAITKNLEITGTATAKTTDEFKVVFDGVNQNDDNDDADDTQAVATAADGALTGECAVTLATVGKTGTCTFEFKNKSPEGIKASIDSTKLVVYTDSGFATAWTAASDPYFDVEVTPAWTGTKELAKDGTERFTITVKLKKAYVGDDTNPTYTNNFYVKLADITAVQA